MVAPEVNADSVPGIRAMTCTPHRNHSPESLASEQCRKWVNEWSRTIAARAVLQDDFKIERQRLDSRLRRVSQPFFDASLLPEPDRLPPPSCLLTVDHAIRSASSSEAPLDRSLCSMCAACRFCFSVYALLSPCGMIHSPIRSSRLGHSKLWLVFFQQSGMGWLLETSGSPGMANFRAM